MPLLPQQRYPNRPLQILVDWFVRFASTPGAHYNCFPMLRSLEREPNVKCAAENMVWMFDFLHDPF